MQQHSEAFHVMTMQIERAKHDSVVTIHSDNFFIMTQNDINNLLKAVLHDQINREYMTNSGLTEDELDMLHAQIEGQHVSAV